MIIIGNNNICYSQRSDEILVPVFEIGSNPTIRLSEIKARRFYIVDRAQMKAKNVVSERFTPKDLIGELINLIKQSIGFDIIAECDFFGICAPKYIRTWGSWIKLLKYHIQRFNFQRWIIKHVMWLDNLFKKSPAS